MNLYKSVITEVPPSSKVHFCSDNLNIETCFFILPLLTSTASPQGTWISVMQSQWKLKGRNLIQITLEYLGVPLSVAHYAICEHEVILFAATCCCKSIFSACVTFKTESLQESACAARPKTPWEVQLLIQAKREMSSDGYLFFNQTEVYF